MKIIANQALITSTCGLLFSSSIWGEELVISSEQNSCNITYRLLLVTTLSFIPIFASKSNLKSLVKVKEVYPYWSRLVKVSYAKIRSFSTLLFAKFWWGSWCSSWCCCEQGKTKSTTSHMTWNRTGVWEYVYLDNLGSWPARFPGKRWTRQFGFLSEIDKSIKYLWFSIGT